MQSPPDRVSHTPHKKELTLALFLDFRIRPTATKSRRILGNSHNEPVKCSQHAFPQPSWPRIFRDALVLHRGLVIPTKLVIASPWTKFISVMASNDEGARATERIAMTESCRSSKHHSGQAAHRRDLIQATVGLPPARFPELGGLPCSTSCHS